MRLATVRRPDGSTRAARRDDEVYVELPYRDVGAVLASGTDWRNAALTASGPIHRGPDVQLAPVVLSPSKIICVGLNYRTHLHELGREEPSAPTLFAKFASALIGPKDPIVLPFESDKVDWEAELACVIGHRVRRAGPEQAADAIAGYTIANDISMRDWQWRTTQWLAGKTFDACTPIGPELVTPDELGDQPGRPELALSCVVDGQVMQQANTGDLLFSPADVVAYVSVIMTLEPGDLILTGTPGGVGAGRDPEVFLKSGVVVRTRIGDLGELVNECTRETAS